MLLDSFSHSHIFGNAPKWDLNSYFNLRFSNPGEVAKQKCILSTCLGRQYSKRSTEADIYIFKQDEYLLLISAPLVNPHCYLCWGWRQIRDDLNQAGRQLLGSLERHFGEEISRGK